MARTKPGPVPERGPLISRAVDSLNLLQDIMIFDRRVKLSSLPDTEGAVHVPRITRLGEMQKPMDISPRCGSI